MAVLVLGVAGCGADSSSNSEARRDPAATNEATTAPAPVTGRRTTVSMVDLAFKPDAMSAKAGKLRVTAKNDGKLDHELVLIRTKKAPDALPTKGSKASEAGSVGEIPDQKPGKSASHTFKLKPGAYVYICNLPGHYTAGMRGALTVK
jgi:uncharacterized cupredoxin-like copper-binding protein